MNPEVISQLEDLGLTKYEALCYFALLKKNPATGYEIAAVSGIPRSAIYTVLTRLESVGIINCVCKDPRRYVPLNPQKLLNFFEQKNISRLNALNKAMSHIEVEKSADEFWNIIGYDQLLSKTKEVLKTARQDIYLSLWQREFEAIRDILSDLKKQVNIVIFSFTEIDPGWTPFSYQKKEQALEQEWDHRIILIVDKKEAIMGGAEKDAHNIAVWTTSRPIVEMAINQIITDITLLCQRKNIDCQKVLENMMTGRLQSFSLV